MIYFVTGNDKKWNEIKEMLGDKIDIERANIDLPEMQGASLEEIAIEKAKAASLALNGAAVITEDTALCFDSLGNLPGPYIKWFIESMGVEKVPRILDGFTDRGADAVCTLTYLSANDADSVVLLQGRTKGHISLNSQGPTTFGWDSIFVPEGSDLTYAQMSFEHKCQISHRAKALKKLEEFFTSK